MFSSLATFIFGLNTNSETNSERTATAEFEESKKLSNSVKADNVYESTSLSPSIAGAGGKANKGGATKSGKNKRNNARQQKKRNENKTPLGKNLEQEQFLTPDNTSDETDFDESEWFIVEREEVRSEDYPILNDSEEENIPLKPVETHIGSPSSSRGLHPPNVRTYPERLRNRRSKGISCSKLSPSRTVADVCSGAASADGVVAPSSNSQQDEEKAVMANNDLDAVNSMDESWFVTPPPCFTSIGPINMETSPYENLLIEHPSMSVYNSIKMSQKSADDFTKLDNLAEEQPEVKQQPTPEKATQELAPRRMRRFTARFPHGNLYQQDDRNMQMIQIKNEQQLKGRCILLRTNRARDVESRNHILRRSDRQYSRFCSNASNNRKTNCY